MYKEIKQFLIELNESLSTATKLALVVIALGILSHFTDNTFVTICIIFVQVTCLCHVFKLDNKEPEE